MRLHSTLGMRSPVEYEADHGAGDPDGLLRTGTSAGAREKAVHNSEDACSAFELGLTECTTDPGLGVRFGGRVERVRAPHRSRGKSDPIDAELAARHVLAANRPVVAKDTSGIVEAIRQLRVARDGAVKARTAALNALSGLIITAPEDLRRQLTTRKTKRARARLCERLRPDPRRLREPEQAAKAALRSLARRITELDGEIQLLDQQLAQLVAEAAPITINRVAVGAGHAATLLVTAGQNIDRLRHEASFAALCAASPIPVSSGRTDRHRLNYGGDRDANRALHMIAVCRLRHCERTRAYAARRTAEGKTKTEIIRCLKRYIARELYHALVADLLAQPGTPGPRAPIMSVTCGAGPIGHTIRS
jgi:transposase